VQYGFFWCRDEGDPKAVYHLCGSVLSTQSNDICKLTILMPLQNQGHILNTIWICKKKKNIPNKIKKHLSVLDKALVASFQVFELIAQQKKAHTIGGLKNLKNYVR
jgi:hypothetical protein